jgi:proline iminopeptidase
MHPDRVTEMILRGPTLWRKAEMDWNHRMGANWLFPEAWDAFTASIPPEERNDLPRAIIAGSPITRRAVRKAAARAWGAWESAIVSLVPDVQFVASTRRRTRTVLRCSNATTWSTTRGFVRIRSCSMAQDPPHPGRCRVWPLRCDHARADLGYANNAGPNSRLVVVPDAGHAFTEPGVARAMVQASDRFAG